MLQYRVDPLGKEDPDIETTKDEMKKLGKKMEVDRREERNELIHRYDEANGRKEN